MEKVWWRIVLFFFEGFDFLVFCYVLESRIWRVIDFSEEESLWKFVCEVYIVGLLGEVEYKIKVKGYEKCYKLELLLNILEYGWREVVKDIWYVEEGRFDRRKKVIEEDLLCSLFFEDIFVWGLFILFGE